MNVLEYRLRDDIPTKLAAFERTVHDNENQSTKTVDDDMRVKEHLIQNSTRTQQYIDSQPIPMQLGANPKSKGEGKVKDVNGKGKGKGAQNESPKKAKNDDEKVPLLQQVRPREG